MAVHSIGRSMCSPTSVCNSHMVLHLLLEVEILSICQFLIAQGSQEFNFSFSLDDEGLSTWKFSLGAICKGHFLTGGVHADSSRIIPPVLQSSEPSQKGVQDVFPVSDNIVVVVAEDPTHFAEDIKLWDSLEGLGLPVPVQAQGVQQMGTCKV